MNRVLFDSSVYGKLVIEEDILDIVRHKHKNHEFIIYGSKIIRDELRNTLRTILYKTRKLRILLLNIYDNFIIKDNHNLKFNKLIETLSYDYFKEYRKNRGNLSHEAIKNDFIIVATATIYQLDIIVSDDQKTMLAEKAIKSYKAINQKYGLIDPKFKTYEEFKHEIK